MDADYARMLLGYLVLPLVGVCLLLVGWGDDSQPIYTLLGFAVLVAAIIIVATSRRLRANLWRDWFPF